MEGNDDDEEGLFAPMMILLKRVFVIGNTSTHTHEKVFSLSSLGFSSGQKKHFLPFFKNGV